MKPRTLIVLGCMALLGGGLAWRFTPRPATSTSSSVGAPTTPSAPGSPAAKSTATAKPSFSQQNDPAAVFQRAFWRRPDASVRILGAERREWADEKSAVQKWEWFIALEAKPEFRRWLIDENPFELVRADISDATIAATAPPEWFPAFSVLRDLAAFRVRGGGLRVFLDAKSGRIFASDAGSGFAASVR